MKQKIVMGMSLYDDKSRSKALKIAVCTPGVESAAVIGEERDQLAVTGDGVDSVDLTRRLRKKMGHADLLSVGDANSEQLQAAAAAADPPAVGVVAPPYYAFPHVRRCEAKEPACYSPCSIL